MNNWITLMAIVEGRTERNFCNRILKPHLETRCIELRAIEVSKPGQKGGDVRFQRIEKDLKIYLEQREDTYITTFIDYYGLREMPGLAEAQQLQMPQDIANVINEQTKAKVVSVFAEQRAEIRFIPYVAIHEFEALLFSDSEILSEGISCAVKDIDKVLNKFNNQPEFINNSQQTAPSKRINQLSGRGFKKARQGIDIAKKIGIDKMREKCPLFNDWLTTLENLKPLIN